MVLSCNSLALFANLESGDGANAVFLEFSSKSGTKTS